ncbi:MAG TPA: hypothetical protein HA224_02755 [Nanoarchaeota archaeon]|nr:hypothetical protein [Nanoarchaeota archaeon]
MIGKKADLTVTQILLIVLAVIFTAAVLYFLLFRYSTGVSDYTKNFILPFGTK